MLITSSSSETMGRGSSVLPVRSNSGETFAQCAGRQHGKCREKRRGDLRIMLPCCGDKRRGALRRPLRASRAVFRSWGARSALPKRRHGSEFRPAARTHRHTDLARLLRTSASRRFFPKGDALRQILCGAPPEELLNAALECRESAAMWAAVPQRACLRS